MKIQFNTDKNIEGHERLEKFFTSELEKELARFDDKVTRIEVHLGDKIVIKEELMTNVV